MHSHTFTGPIDAGVERCRPKATNNRPRLRVVQSAGLRLAKFQRWRFFARIPNPQKASLEKFGRRLCRRQRYEKLEIPGPVDLPSVGIGDPKHLLQVRFEVESGQLVRHRFESALNEDLFQFEVEVMFIAGDLAERLGRIRQLFFLIKEGVGFAAALLKSESI